MDETLTLQGAYYLVGGLAALVIAYFTWRHYRIAQNALSPSYELIATWQDRHLVRLLLVVRNRSRSRLRLTDVRVLRPRRALISYGFTRSTDDEETPATPEARTVTLENELAPASEDPTQARSQDAITLFVAWPSLRLGNTIVLTLTGKTLAQPTKVFRQRLVTRPEGVRPS